ncbi:MAG: GlsB/YeaQ/YmgE family stress response membrane protein [Cellulomonadaceae bacterium]
MWILSWILIGLIMGAIARAVLPGRVSGGWVVTLIVGVVGALVGGWIATGLFNVETNESFFSLTTWFWAFIGSLVVLGIYGAITGRSKKA